MYLISIGFGSPCLVGESDLYFTVLRHLVTIRFSEKIGRNVKLRNIWTMRTNSIGSKSPLSPEGGIIITLDIKIKNIPK